MKRALQAAILFWLGVIGTIFYIVRPILFPDVANEPEMLPVLTMMMGLGRAIRPSKNDDDDE